LDQLARVHDGVVLDSFGEQALDGREVALDQERGDGLAVSAEGDDLAVVGVRDRDRDRAAVAEGLAYLLERAGWNEGGDGLGEVAVAGIPVDLAYRDAVAVSRDEAQGRVADLELHTRDDGGHIVAGGGDRNLGDRVGEGIR